MTEPMNSCNTKCLFVTGGAGFIGSNFVLEALSRGYSVVNIDRLSYAAGVQMLHSADSHPNYFFVKADICDEQTVAEVFNRYLPTAVIHLAAETHVDRSIASAHEFVHSNVAGCHGLLNQSLIYWRGLSEPQQSSFRFLHISTDEVYGSLGHQGVFHESTAYDPHSPYSATKAAGDHLVRAWNHTFGLPSIIAHPSNNYGPNQHPEKLIPRVIHCCLAGKPIPVYGDGMNVRDWLFVEDFCEAMFLLLQHGIVGQSYNIGGNNEWRNLELVQKICDLVEQYQGRGVPGSCRKLIQMVKDRPGHDFRYSMDCSKFQNLCGWQPKQSADTGFQKTVEWYLNHVDRLQLAGLS